jgi:hypothetical protein
LNLGYRFIALPVPDRGLVDVNDYPLKAAMIAKLEQAGIPNGLRKKPWVVYAKKTLWLSRRAG